MSAIGYTIHWLDPGLFVLILSLRRLVALAGTAVALVLLAAGVSCHNDELAAARAEAQQAIARAASAQKATATSMRAADSLRERADSAAAASRRAELRADSAQRAAERARGAYELAKRDAPDTCAQVIAHADSVISAQDTTITGLRLALDSSVQARSDLQTALDTTQAAIVRLRASDADLIHATSVLVKHSHEPFLLKLLPHPGIGGVAGLDIHGEPNIVTGLSLTWSVSF